MNERDNSVLRLARSIDSEIKDLYRPPDDGIPAVGQAVVPFAVVRGTRGYIEKIANQVNGSYDRGWYDACAVMLRRLIDTLLIESFEKHKVDFKIKSAGGEFLRLEEIIDQALIESSWNLGRNAKSALPRLKKLGDLSAHARRYNARLPDIHPLLPDVRVVVEELVYIAGLK